MQKVKLLFYSVLNKIFPKYYKVLIIPFPNVESSAIEVANHISANYKIPVTYVISKELKDNPTSLLSSDIKVISNSSPISDRLAYLLEILTSRYIFHTHGIFLSSFSKRQVVTNIWHGVYYKKIGRLIGGKTTPADITVGTSELTKKMFSEAFGVSSDSVFVCGYPRNDVLINSKRDRKALGDKIDKKFNSFNKIIIWLPTFRKKNNTANWLDGKEIGNPFYIPDFDVQYFNQLLKERNSLCIVKPHPMAVKYSNLDNLSNLLFVDDKWISDKGITLYQLVGCTDILISDVSSVLIDYLLLDQPILCVSTDLEEYKKTRGFYFDEIEEWLPGPVLRSQLDLFHELKVLLANDQDRFEAKRQKLKGIFF